MTVLSIKYHRIFILHSKFKLKYWMIGKAKLSKVLVLSLFVFYKAFKEGCVIAHVSLRKDYIIWSYEGNVRQMILQYLPNKITFCKCRDKLESSLYLQFARFWKLSISMKTWLKEMTIWMRNLLTGKIAADIKKILSKMMSLLLHMKTMKHKFNQWIVWKRMLKSTPMKMIDNILVIDI